MEDPGEAVGKYPGPLIDRLQDVALLCKVNVMSKIWLRRARPDLWYSKHFSSLRSDARSWRRESICDMYHVSTRGESHKAYQR